ncbi:MAG: glycerol kinase [Rhizobiaceae bacterium]|nr:glycerol kinase [Rhizobiaceae bacterium]
MPNSQILAIDQGTGSTKALVIDADSKVVSISQAPVSISAPQPGWVEQDAEEIWGSVLRAVQDALDSEKAKNIAAVGFSNQRESCVIWDRRTGEALSPVLSWQDKRAESLCSDIEAAGHADTVRSRCGLPLDPMFSAAKARWLLDRIPQGQQRAKAGDICIGTIDSFILSRFGGDAVIEAGNASRTQLLNVVEGRWDEDLLEIFNIPLAALPRVVGSTGPFPNIRGLAPLADGTPIGAVLADSHSALFAHGALAPGLVKATHGTGSSVMGLVDREMVVDGQAGAPGVCLTIAWQIDKPALAYEGVNRSSGSTLVWVAELLGISVDELAVLASTVPNSQGVSLVPAFSGLAAPWWDPGACAIASGFSFGVTRAPFARAAIDSIAHQIADVIEAFRASGAPVERMLVDGGPTRNNQLLQFEADIMGVPVERSPVAELSALGAAQLAGVSAGLFTLDALAKLDRGTERFSPHFDTRARLEERDQWVRAVARSRGLPVTSSRQQAQ